MTTTCERPRCPLTADHLWLGHPVLAEGQEELPRGTMLCRDHYRELRPYTVSRAALDTFSDMLTPGERAKWTRIVNEQDAELEAQANVGSQGDLAL